MSSNVMYKHSTATSGRVKITEYTCMVCNENVDGKTGRLYILKQGKKYKKGPAHHSCMA